MPYDLILVHELCQEIGLNSAIRSSNELAIELENDVVLLIVNSEKEADCLITFEGNAKWHTHDDFVFSDPRGYYKEMTYFDVVAGIPNGEILIAEVWRDNQLDDRWLAHKDYVDEFRFLEEGEEVRIRRISPTK